MWDGNGVFVWQVKMSTGGFSANSAVGWETLAKTITSSGIKMAPVKVADGPYVFNKTQATLGWRDDILDGLYATYKKYDIKPMGWQYIYGSAPIAEANIAVQLIKRLSLTHFIIDAEAQYKQPGMSTKAAQYMDILIKQCPDVHFALCSYRYPSLHREFPWYTFLSYLDPDKDCHMPQVYWEAVYDPPYPTNPATQMQRSYNELIALKKLPVVPVGAAYGAGVSGSSYWAPSLKQQESFAKAAKDLGCPGILWWELGTMLKPDFIQRGYYGSMPKYSAMFGVSAPPELPPTQDYTDEQKLSIMWADFIKEHPEYAR